MSIVFEAPSTFWPEDVSLMFLTGFCSALKSWAPFSQPIGRRT